MERLLEKFPVGLRDATSPYADEDQISKKFVAATHNELVLLNKHISLAQLELSQSESKLKRAYARAFKYEKLQY